MWIVINGQYVNLSPLCIHNGMFRVNDVNPFDWDGIFESTAGFHYLDGKEWLTIYATCSKLKAKEIIEKQMIELYIEFGDWKLVFECMKV